MICGIGIDLVEVARMETMLARWQKRFLARVFTPQEIAQCEARMHRAASYAARFAAKEAFAKALGTGWDEHFSWQDFSIGNDAAGKPIPILSARMQARLANVKIHVSLTHSEHYASAVIVFEK